MHGSRSTGSAGSMAGHGHGSSTAQVWSRGRTLSLNAAHERKWGKPQLECLPALYLQQSESESSALYWGAGLEHSS